MPIFRINKDLHYFAHVPKCGGTSIDNYLTRRFGPLGFNSSHGALIPPHMKWNRSSTQHVPVYALEQLLPPDWFASSFAVVRNPLGRLISAYFFAKADGRVPDTTDFNAWFQDAATRIETRPFDHDGHLLPQSTFVPNGSRIFRFEDGLDQIIPYLDGLSGNQDGPREIEARNVGRWRSKTDVPVPTTQTLALIAQVYAEDFARFGYSAATEPADAETASTLPVLPATGKPPEPKPHSLSKRIKWYLIRKARM